jgi:hypothetical protein
MGYKDKLMVLFYSFIKLQTNVSLLSKKQFSAEEITGR